MFFISNIDPPDLGLRLAKPFAPTLLLPLSRPPTPAQSVNHRLPHFQMLRAVAGGRCAPYATRAIFSALKHPIAIEVAVGFSSGLSRTGAPFETERSACRKFRGKTANETNGGRAVLFIRAYTLKGWGGETFATKRVNKPFL